MKGIRAITIERNAPLLLDIEEANTIFYRK